MLSYRYMYGLFFFFKQKTAYVMRISDWSSDVCSSDLNWDEDKYLERTGWSGRDDGILVYDANGDGKVTQASEISFLSYIAGATTDQIGRESCRERVSKYV